MKWIDSQLRPLAERHALIAFFGLPFAISWSLWGVQFLLASADPISARWLGTIAAYGPTLAAIALAGLLPPEVQPAVRPEQRLWLTGALLAGTMWLNSAFASSPLDSTRPLVAALLWLAVTLLPAGVLWGIFSGRRGVRAILHTLGSWRAPPIWYLAALLIPVSISTAGMALLALLGQPLPAWPRAEPLPALLPLLVTTFTCGCRAGGADCGKQARIIERAR